MTNRHMGVPLPCLFFLTGFLFTVFAENISFTGRTEPYNFSTISATVPGRISSIIHNVGSFVTKGDTILHLEKEEEELEVKRRVLIAESKVELAAAEHTLQIVKKDFEATKQLFDSVGTVSESELWEKELEYTRAIEEVKRIELAEKREAVEHEIASAQLQKRFIYAPFTGEVVKVFLREGESCNAQEPLVRIVNVKKCRFISHIEPVSAKGLSKGMSVTLLIEGSKTPAERTGKIEYISSVVEAKSGLLEVRVTFNNGGKKIRPGGLGAMIIKPTETAIR